MGIPRWIVLVALLPGAAQAAATGPQTALPELVGLEYLPPPPRGRIAAQPDCAYEGGGPVHVGGLAHEDWSEGLIECRGRWVKTLERAVGRPGGGAAWRIVDALPLPPIELDPSARRDALRLYGNGECELAGRTDTSFFALVRFGTREEIDGRTGVERAWTFDLRRGRIVPMSTRQIVCYWLDP